MLPFEQLRNQCSSNPGINVRLHAGNSVRSDRNTQLSERLETNSKNSSLAPSKDRSSKNKSNIKRNEQRRKNPKKPGG